MVNQTVDRVSNWFCLAVAVYRLVVGVITHSFLLVAVCAVCCLSSSLLVHDHNNLTINALGSFRNKFLISLLLACLVCSWYILLII